MESILARALEYTLKYWLKSFSRDQFKLQGRTAQLSNLDLDGDALHSSMGLPPALSVVSAKVGKLEITLPAVSYVQVEPIVIQVDKLNLVLEEKSDSENTSSSNSGQSSANTVKGSGYGFADKIADGMTVEVGTVNLLIQTRGGAGSQGGATWSPPLASITIRNLLLYTTNENWQVVSLNVARDFSNKKNFIYVFKKLEWGSLSVDLLPHPDMFTDACMTSSGKGMNSRDDDGAKRLFFGGERFLEGISGQAYITLQRTELNSPLGLEVQLHVTEAVCPALSEPGLRALLRFMTGFYVCLNRGDLNTKAQQHSTETAGRSLVSVTIDHIFLCIKDAEFQLELLMQSLFYSRASVTDGEYMRNLSRVMVGGLFLRDTFSQPPCTLIQPSMFSVANKSVQAPDFGENFCPPIYPLGDKHWQFDVGVPLISLHSLQRTPSPAPPYFASQTVIDCQPLTIILKEESCFRIVSFLADGIFANPTDVLPDFSVNSFQFSLKRFDLTIPLDASKVENYAGCRDTDSAILFSGARLHVEDLFFTQSPAVKCKLLNLGKDPACFSLWEGQPIDSSQKKWATRASHLSLSLETVDRLTDQKDAADWSAGLWRCVELHEACIEAAMVTADGGPLVVVPPPEGIVRIGVACQEYSSNTSVEQLFFVLSLYAYFGQVSEKISQLSKVSGKMSGSMDNKLIEKIPSDTAVSLAVNSLQLSFLEPSSFNIQGMPLVQFGGDDLFVKVSHRTLGGAFAVSTSVQWKSICINCVEQDRWLSYNNGICLPSEPDSQVLQNGHPQMRTVFWIEQQNILQKKPDPFLVINATHVVPYNVRDMECHSLNILAKVSGVRLGGGMNYTETLLHRFGILGPDGGPGEGLSQGLKKLSSGPLAKLFRTSSPIVAGHENDGCSEDGDHTNHLELGMPDDIDVAVELNNWLFALEGAQEMEAGWLNCNGVDIGREERCWHTTFHSLFVRAKSRDNRNLDCKQKSSASQRYPVELITVGVEGLQALKPRCKNVNVVVPNDLIRSNQAGIGMKTIGTVDEMEGVNVEVCLVLPEDENAEAVKWMVENMKFSVKKPIEAIATKEELEHLIFLCRSEVDSMGRIAAGILRLLKLDKSIGQGTMDQLNNLGTESVDKIFAAPNKPSTLTTSNSAISSPRTPNSFVPVTQVESTFSLLEAEIAESQTKCIDLISELSNSGPPVRIEDMRQLHQKLESMQILLTRLRTLV